MKKNPIDEMLLKLGFNDDEAEVFNKILKFARASQATATKDSLKSFISNQIDTLTDHEN